MMTYGFTRYDNFTSNFTRPCHDMSIVYNEGVHVGEKMKLQIHTKADAEGQDLVHLELSSQMCIKDQTYTWPNGTLKVDSKCRNTSDDLQNSWNNPLNGNKRINKTFQDLFFGPYLDLEFTIKTGGKYQVIENARAFSVENCWSGIGGFVGIFVGLSLMAVPDLLQDFYHFLKTKLLGT